MLSNYYYYPYPYHLRQPALVYLQRPRRAPDSHCYYNTYYPDRVPSSGYADYGNDYYDNGYYDEYDGRNNGNSLFADILPSRLKLQLREALQRRQQWEREQQYLQELEKRRQIEHLLRQRQLAAEVERQRREQQRHLDQLLPPIFLDYYSSNDNDNDDDATTMVMEQERLPKRTSIPIIIDDATARHEEPGLLSSRTPTGVEMMGGGGKSDEKQIATVDDDKMEEEPGSQTSGLATDIPSQPNVSQRADDRDDQHHRHTQQQARGDSSNNTSKDANNDNESVASSMPCFSSDSEYNDLFDRCQDLIGNLGTSTGNVSSPERRARPPTSRDKCQRSRRRRHRRRLCHSRRNIHYDECNGPRPQHTVVQATDKPVEPGLSSTIEDAMLPSATTTTTEATLAPATGATTTTITTTTASSDGESDANSVAPTNEGTPQQVKEALAVLAAINKELADYRDKHQTKVLNTSLEFIPAANNHNNMLVAYNERTKPFHHYYHFLETLLSRLDMILSYGEVEIRSVRKETIKQIQEALDRLDAFKRRQFQLREGVDL